jgi:hypothetical protein
VCVCVCLCEEDERIQEEIQVPCGKVVGCMNLVKQYHSQADLDQSSSDTVIILHCFSPRRGDIPCHGKD